MFFEVKKSSNKQIKTVSYCWLSFLIVKAIGLIPIADIKKNNDYAMWLKVCQKAVCYLLDEVLAKYRMSILLHVADSVLCQSSATEARLGKHSFEAEIFVNLGPMYSRIGEVKVFSLTLASVA